MRHLSFLIMLIIAINAHCQQNARYEVFKALGRISNASTGQKLKKGDAVKLTDKLNIGKRSKAGILDRQQNRIYYSLNRGTYTVASILQDAKRKADNTVATVNSEMLRKSNQATKRPIVNGVAYRGSEGENMYLQSVCNAIFDIESTMPDDRLTLKAVKDDGAFYFSMTNDTDSLVYVNVVAVSPEKTPQLCLNIGMTHNEPYISIAPNSKLTLPEFVFVDDESTTYYMLALSEPVDTQALTLLLNAGKRFEDTGSATILVSPKIGVQ